MLNGFFYLFILAQAARPKAKAQVRLNATVMRESLLDKAAPCPSAHAMTTCSLRCGSQLSCNKGASAGTENLSRVLSIESSISFCHFTFFFSPPCASVGDREAGSRLSPKRG